MARLAEYRRKRDFAATPEPRGKRRGARSGHSFVIQKHAARRLHYDFRLELDGVLKSWAVPKGPSLDPGEKRLAVETEDHPVEYGGFEGTIPEGEYGAGSVVVWDRGRWEPIDDAHRGLERGKLAFRLHGEKLQGRWALVRIRSRDRRDTGKNWLLIKERDEWARSGHDLTVERPGSVLSGRDVEEVARANDRVWHSSRPAARAAPRRGTPAPAPPDAATLPGARRARLPNAVELQLATLVAAAPEGDRWLHEMKFDGYRIAARLEDGRARLVSRNGADWTERFGSVARAVERLPARAAWLDGEVAVLLPDGTTSFNALQNALSANRRGELVYFVFDLLHLDGRDLTRVPLEARKEALRRLLAAGDAAPVCRYSEHVVGGGPEFFRQACRFALEGIVSKQRDAPYAGGRGRSWLKTKCVREQEFVIGGFTEPSGRRAGIGALLVGVHERDGTLVYAGKVGTGFTDAVARDLRRRLDALEDAACPFATRPREARAHWVRAELVAEVAFTEWTPDGRLRHPSFRGLREDKPPRAIVREEPASGVGRRAKRRHGTPVARKPSERTTGPSADDAVELRGVRLTHPHRVLYPRQGVTKLALARFYESIADWIIPHLRSRPTTLVRCPRSVDGDCFYQKHVGHWAPPSLRRIRIQERRKVGEYLVVDDLPGLIGLVQIGILEIHTWNSRTEHLEQPDRLVFDLDPGEGVPWRAVIAAARLLRARLQATGLESFVKTTGGKGLHLVCPIERGPDWNACAAFARGVAEALAHEAPDAFTASSSKAHRAGRLFVDWLRNVRGATTVAAFSTRAHPDAPVSTPLAWDELDARRDSRHYTIANVPRRLSALRADPWAGYDALGQKLPAPGATGRGAR